MKQKIKKTSPIKDWPSLFKLLYVPSLPMGHKLHLKPDVNIEFFPTSFLPPGSLVEPSVASPEQKTFRDSGSIIPFRNYTLRSLFISGLDIKLLPTSFKRQNSP